MIAKIQFKQAYYHIDLSKPIDISIPIDDKKPNVNAWYIDNPKIYPEVFEGQKIKVSEGASVNFNSILFNPHSHITHTECVGHITKNVYSVNKSLNRYFFLAELITVIPQKVDNDFIISKEQIQEKIKGKNIEGIIIRTLPNSDEKKSRRYSNTNPPYLSEEATIYLREIGINHLLIDLPSVDKEKDGGKLVSHNAFWNTANTIRLKSTITEFIYVPNKIKDGIFFLNLMIAPFENDATPSKPVLYNIEKVE